MEGVDGEEDEGEGEARLVLVARLAALEEREAVLAEDGPRLQKLRRRIAKVKVGVKRAGGGTSQRLISNILGARRGMAALSHAVEDAEAGGGGTAEGGSGQIGESSGADSATVE